MGKILINSELDGLRNLYKEEHSKIILDDFSKRNKGQRVTTVDQVLNRLRDAGLSRWAVIALFKELERLSYGRFIEGRKGHLSRFVWSSNQIEVGKVAQGELNSIAPVSTEKKGEGGFEEIRSYQFPLRAGTDATLQLPSDLTQREAERLAAFIKTLALSDE
ncbi:MAG: hypothetical protein ACYC46_05110 [Acidobacteriaceae bacterium]